MLGFLTGIHAHCAVVLQAQSPEWTATLVMQPFPSPFLSGWERNPQTAILSILYSGHERPEFRVEGTLHSAGHGQFARALSPVRSVPVGPSVQIITTADLPDWRVLSYESSHAEAARRAGILPQGQYRACVRVLNVQGIQLAQDCADFTILLPDPPQLILPVHGAVIETPQPVFQWTPVSAPPEIGLTYRLRVVERNPGQTPQTALQANPPHLDLDVSGVPLAVYPPDALPFEEGREYVWQLETLDAAGAPITAGQRHSEIWAFSYQGPSGLPSRTGLLPDPFELLPGVASLSGSSLLEVRETDSSYILNGAATLDLEGPLHGRIGVELHDLELDKWALPGIRVLRGRVTGRLSPDVLPLEPQVPHVRFEELEYTPTAGLMLSGYADLPGQGAVRLSGRVTVTAAGLTGMLSAEAVEGSALFVVGADPVALHIHRVRATYPEAELEVTGKIDVFERDAGCREIVGRLGADGLLTALVNCQPNLEVPLAPGVEQVRLHVLAMSGSLAIELTAPGTLAYELTTVGEVHVAGDAVRCRAAMEVLLKDGAVEPKSFRPLCDPAQASIELDWLRLGLSNLRLERFDYGSNERFDFSFRLDAKVRVPSLPDFDLPELTGIAFRPEGIEFPELNVVVDRPRFDLDGLGVRIRSVRMPGWTLPLPSWDRRTERDTEGRGGFRFALDMDLVLPRLSQAAPICLTSGTFDVTGAELAEGRLAIATAERLFDPACVLPLGGGVSFELRSLGGQVTADLTPELSLEQSLEARGALVLPPLFQCPGEADRRLVLGTSIFLAPNGVLTGSATGLHGGCPFRLGGFEVALSHLELEFGEDDGRQSVVLAGGAQVSFAHAAEPVNGSGSIVLDLVTGRVRGGRVDFHGPFGLDLPPQVPALSFRIGAAHLDSLGLHVDGQQELLLPGGRVVSVTFEDATFGLAELAIVSGRIVFDPSFAFEVGLLEDGNLAWRAVAHGAPLEAEPGLRLDLPPQIVLDSAGFSARGDGGALLSFEERLFEELVARASEDFTLSLEPFRVSRGALELEYDGHRIAHVDRLGFHPNLAFLESALVPDRIGLPNEEMAYLELRDEQGTMRVDAEVTPAGVRIVNKAGTTVRLMVPALGSGAPSAPEVHVTFDLTLDPFGGHLISGSFGVRVPSTQAAAFDLRDRGVPFVVDSIAYDAADAGHLKLGGRLALFDERQGGETEVVLTLDGTGRVEAEIHVGGPFQPIDLRDGGGFRLGVGGIEGWISAQPKLGVVRYELAAASTLTLTLDGIAEYAIGATIVASDHGFAVSHLDLPETGDPALDIGFGRLRLSHFRVPSLEYESARGVWDFEVLFDAELVIPELDGLVLPGLQDIALRPDGLTLPGFEVPQLSAAPIEVAGFQLRPLAFRMEPLHIAWFASPQEDGGFGFDLELGFGEDAPPHLRATHLTVLDAGYRDGRFTGSIEPRTLPQPLVVPMPGGEMALRVLRLGGILADQDGVQEVRILAGGWFLLPESMRCGSEADWVVELPPTAMVTLSSAGWASGTVTDVVPRCPLRMGPLALSITSSTLSFRAGPSSQQVELDLDGWLVLPAPIPGDTVRAAGSLGVDLVGLRVLRGNVEIDTPFRWNVPAEDPLLRFIVRNARLDAYGLHLSGSGWLDLKPDGLETAIPGQPAAFDAQAQVEVTYTNLLLRLPDFRIVGGQATIEHSFALDVGLEPSHRPRFLAREPNEPRETGAGFRILLPERVELEETGLRIDGIASAEIEYGAMRFDALRVEFTEFLLEHEPRVRVASGRAGFMLDEQEIAYIDPTGFWPGSVFAVLPIPDRLGLPSEDVAYLQLRDPETGGLLISSVSGPEGLTIRTDGTQPVPLVVPALERDGQVPLLPIHFEATLNPANHQFVSGFVRVESPVEAPALFTLDDFGVPLEVRTLAYEKVGSEYVLRLDLRLGLPESMGGQVLAFDHVLVTRSGLSGSVEIGKYVESFQPGAQPVFVHALTPDVDFELYGALATFDPDERTLRLAGALRTPLFATPDERPSALFVAGQLGPAGFDLSADVSHSPHLPIASATFELAGIGSSAAAEVRVSPQELALRLSGILRMPSLSETFQLTVEGLEIGSNGIIFPSVALQGAEELQAFSLFGATFTLRDSIAGGQEVYPAIAFDYAERVLHLTLSGDLEFLGTKSRFYGLRIGTDGSLTLAQANLLSRPVVLVPTLITLAQLSVVDRKLRADLDITLPEPLTTNEAQRAHFSVATDGTVDGGAYITLLSESPGLGTAGGVQRTQQDFGIATFHPHHIGLALQFGALEQSALEVVADIYLASEAENRIMLGNVNGGTVAPGLHVAFDGSTHWGNFGLARDFEFDFDVLRLTLENVSAPRDGEFSVGFSGSLSLNLQAIEGGIDFTDFRITRRGRVEVDPHGITGGYLSIAGVVNLEVTELSYSDTPTEIEVASGELPTPQQQASHGTETVAVRSYVRFGGKIDVFELFAGKVEEFLAYRTIDGLRHMIVRKAELEVQNVITMEADLRYRETDGGFEMLLGASGQVLDNYDVTLVGAIEHGGGTTRAGIFVASAVQIPVVPPIIVITQLGGGLFYNPRPEYLDLVRRYADVGGPAAERIQAPTGSFAVLLYGGVSIVDAAVIEGRILLTAMPTALQLDGAVEVLSQDNRFRGDMTLVVGLGKAYAEGNIQFIVDYHPVLSAAGGLEFFVYGANAWGIVGGANMSYLATVSAQSEFFIGPPGFMVSGEISQSFDIWIVSVRSAFGMMAWYHRAANQYGAYTRIAARASVLGGVATARGDLHGALVLGSSPQIYAAGSLRGCAAGKCASIDAHARFRNGSISGGPGRDSSLDAIIAQAQAVADEMAEAQAEAEAAITSAQVDAALITMRDEDLVAAYDVMQRWGASEFDLARSYAVSMESRYAGWLDDLGHYLPYLSILMQEDAPQVDDTMVRQYSDSVAVQLQRIDQRRTAVLASLREIQVHIADQEALLKRQVHIADQEALLKRDPPENPMQHFSFARPVTQTLTHDGLEIKVVESGTMPGFDLDTLQARRAVETLEALDETLAAQSANVLAIIHSLEEGLASVRTAALASGEGSLLGYHQLLAEARSATVRPFAVHADLILRRQDWIRSRLQEMGVTERRLPDGTSPPPPMLTAITAILDRKNQQLANQSEQLYNMARERLQLLDAWVAGRPTPASSTAALSFVGLPVPPSQIQRDNEIIAGTLAAMAAQTSPSFAELLDAIATGQPMAQRFSTEYEGFTQQEARDSLAARQAMAAGLLIWYHLGAAAMQAADERADYAMAALREAYADRLEPIEESYDEVSRTAGRVFAAHAELTGALYDLYDAYIDSGWDSSSELTQRRDALLEELTVPRIENVVMTSATRGYYAEHTVQWSGSHPSGVYEFLFDDTEEGAGLGGSLRSVGGTGHVTSYHFLEARGPLSVNRSVHTGVRGGAGFVGLGRAEYTLAFQPGPHPGTTVTATSSQVVGDTPPAAPVVSFPDLPQAFDNEGQPVAWTTQASAFRPEWWAFDNHSGIAAYEYAIGTTPGGTDVRDWTLVGGRTSVRVEGVDASLDAPIFVAARARSGADLWSDVGVSPPLRLDTIPPAFADGAALELMDAPAGAGGGVPPVLWQACPIPIPVALGSEPAIVHGVSSDPLAGSEASTMVPASRSILRPRASDQQSGIWRYLWRIGEASADAFTGSGWTAVPADQAQIELAGPPLDYERAFFVSVVGQNRAGLVTREPLVLGPFTVSDPTAPRPPRFCLGIGGQGALKLDIEQPGEDLETGIAGYAFRLLEDGMVVRAWPDSADWQILPKGVAMLPFADLREGRRYEVELRALNGQGQWGRAARSGPVLHDLSPPPRPSVSAVVSPSVITVDVTGQSAPTGTRLRVSVTAPEDLESGLHAQHYAVYTAPTTPTTTGRSEPSTLTVPVLVVDWRALPSPQEGPSTREVQLPVTLAPGDYHIRLRTINRSGLVSLVGQGHFNVPEPSKGTR